MPDCHAAASKVLAENACIFPEQLLMLMAGIFLAGRTRPCRTTA